MTGLINPKFPHSSLGDNAAHWSSGLRIATQLRRLAKDGFRRTADETDSQCLACQYAIAGAKAGEFKWGVGKTKPTFAFSAYLPSERLRCIVASIDEGLVSQELSRMTALGWEVRKKTWE